VKKIGITIGLLLCSNVFMNLAWYGHLKHKTSPLWIAILASWGLAFFEYCLQVPANRIGSEALTTTQLKIIQEVLSLATFVIIAFFMFKEKPTTNQLISFGLIIAAAYFAMKK
jgi:uncharacterized protein (DUF486 family)